MLTQMTVIIGYGYSVLRYGEQLNAICLVGTILLVSGVFMVIFKKTPLKPAALESKQSN
jgi:drug/metabolite transporter (DMT)-like permease